MKACIPSMKDSSEPVDTSSTRTLVGRLSASRRATSSSDTTPVALSFAPGTTFVEPICAITAAAPAETMPPAIRATRLPGSDPAAASAGPPKTGNISGGLVSLRSISPGKRRQTKAGIAGWKIRSGLGGVVMRHEHYGSAERPAGPISATTLNVSRLGSRRRE